ncbi:hypothetical protein PR202_ga30839 [Eleusine coracana subsp. coracana]|uniref:Exportin-2 C-terminal domain-containing protein n=1 Tax=Eleusine coracana subsp. coracana TaxID=191504 RepID=A0AAV5DNG2_ELECO|nr:hypothetical protein PR202_ga30839 [Eleusine coracana subsp. coracana]
MDDKWDIPRCIRALVRLLRALLKTIPDEIKQMGHPIYIVAKSLKLLQQRGSEELAFQMLGSLVEFLEYDMLEPLFMEIWPAINSRLERRLKDLEVDPCKFLKHLTLFISLVVIKYSPAGLVVTMNAIQSNLFAHIFESAWVCGLRTIKGVREAKLASVAATMQLCEPSMLLDNGASWGKLLDSTLSMLFSVGAWCQEDVKFELIRHSSDLASISDNILQYAEMSADDLLGDIVDPKKFLVMSLLKLSAQHIGRMGPAI